MLPSRPERVFHVEHPTWTTVIFSGKDALMPKRAKPIPTHRLGRGLSSLIGGMPSTTVGLAGADRPAVPADAPRADGHGSPSPRRRDVPVEHIAPNPYQPRRHFEAAALEELAASISREGILQPLLVVRAQDPAAARPYVLIAGERRLRAARRVGLTTVPCVVREATGEQMLEWSLVENIQRADLNAVERAQAYRSYMDRFNLTQAEVAERTGEARPSIANYLRVLDLSDSVQQMLLDGALTFGHARALAALAGQEDRQVALAQRIVRESLSVRQAEHLVAQRQEAPHRRGRHGQKAALAKPAYVADLEARMTQAVGTRVTILPGRRKNSGRIVIEYYGLDDFDRIARSLGVAEEA